MAEVQWIKIKVGMFDGDSFKKIKRAKIGGEKFRDKLTAVWFELMDFAGRCNHDGAFVDKREIPYRSLDDIATMIDRDTDELELCMQFFINEGMVEIVNDVYMLSNWLEYQNIAGLEKIREQKRLAQAKWRAKKALVESHVDSTEHLPSYSYSSSTSPSEKEGDCKGETMFGPELQAAYEDWLEYKKERREGYKPTGLRNLTSEIKNNADKYGEAAVAEVIRHSMASGWRGIIFDRLKDTRRPGRQDTGFETGNPFLEMLNEERRR